MNVEIQGQCNSIQLNQSSLQQTREIIQQYIVDISEFKKNQNTELQKSQMLREAQSNHAISLKESIKMANKKLSTVETSIKEEQQKMKSSMEEQEELLKKAKLIATKAEESILSYYSEMAKAIN